MKGDKRGSFAVTRQGMEEEMQMMDLVRARDREVRWIQSLLLKGFRTRYSRIYLFDILTNLSYRPLLNRYKKGILTSLLLPESRS